MVITRSKVPQEQRVSHVSAIFSVRFLWFESFVFDVAGSLSSQYDGGYWEYFHLSNHGLYMAPTGSSLYAVQCDNGFEGGMTQEAFGITACLYAYSHLSFSADAVFGGLCADHYHRLRDFALRHAEARDILAATD